MTDLQAPARPDVTLQKRGAERVQALLDAGDTILGESGYEAATLKAIGERAGIPLASIYHYFADRTQVDLAILQRHIHALDAILQAAIAESPMATLRDAVDVAIDPMLAYFRAHPSGRALWFTEQRDASLTVLVRELDETGAELIWQTALDHGLLRDDTPVQVMKVVFEAGSRLFDMAFRLAPDGDDDVIEEARKMAIAYLELYAP